MNPFGNPQKLMKQLQQAQERMQQEIAALQIEATSGGGMVKVVMDGQKNLKSLRIDPEVVSKEDVEMLQDLVIAAVNEAARKVDEAVQEKIGGLTGGHEDPGSLASSRRRFAPRIFPGGKEEPPMKSLLARALVLALTLAGRRARAVPGHHRRHRRHGPRRERRARSRRRRSPSATPRPTSSARCQTDADGRFRGLLLPLGPYRVTRRPPRVRAPWCATASTSPSARPSTCDLHAQGLDRPGGGGGDRRRARRRDHARGGLGPHRRRRHPRPAQQRPQLPRLHQAHPRRDASCRDRTATS